MIRSAHRWIRLYDHRDAEWHLEEMHEWADQEDPEDRESYEFPPVAEAIPEPVSWPDPGKRVARSGFFVTMPRDPTLRGLRRC